MKSMISTVMAVYAFLFILLSHSALMACRYAEGKRGQDLERHLEEIELDPLATSMPAKCPHVSFSIAPNSN